MEVAAAETTKDDHTALDMSATVNVSSISDDAKTALAAVYDRYLDLKDALVADKAGKARKALLKFKTDLESVDMTLFNDDAHMLFMSEREKILGHIPEKKKLTDIEDSRAAFEHVSNGMITLAKAFSPQDGTFYIQHCPMAFNNKGADWISRDHEIRNPYFGASMLTCGDVTDTLETKKEM
jgi:Cu(I)/Ag(I) efflux system membrane fusion protein